MSDQNLADSAPSPVASLALLEQWLDRCLPPADATPEPLHRAMRYAVFSGGKRLRPQFLLHVAHACGIKEPQLELALRAACAVELVHSASLVHDDLPCFDDARERRGRPSVHVLFGESMAVLVGDALLAQGIEVLTVVPRPLAPRALALVRLLVRATSSSSGLIGGQSLEQQHVAGGGQPLHSPDLIERYHIMKTARLFETAAESAAVVAGSTKTAAWAQVGQLFGRFYQLAHDLVAAHVVPGGSHHGHAHPGAHGPPSAVLSRGEGAVWTQLDALLGELQKRIATVAVVPAPMLTFLTTLHEQLVRATGVTPTPPAPTPPTERAPVPRS